MYFGALYFAHISLLLNSQAKPGRVSRGKKEAKAMLATMTYEKPNRITDTPGGRKFDTHLSARLRFEKETRQLEPLKSMPSTSSVPNNRRRRSKVILQDVDLLKQQRLKVKQDLKEMSRNLKLQLQKKRRIMRAANLMDDEDLQWVLRERERAKLNAATNQSGEKNPEEDNANRNRNEEPEG